MDLCFRVITMLIVAGCMCAGTTGATANPDKDRPGTIRFWGNNIADLYTKEIAESYKGVLAKNYVSKPGGEFPLGFHFL